MYGLEKFWAFLKYRKDRRKLSISPTLRTVLSQFTSLDDFRKKKKKKEEDYPQLATSLPSQTCEEEMKPTPVGSAPTSVVTPTVPT